MFCHPGIIFRNVAQDLYQLHVYTAIEYIDRMCDESRPP